MTMSDTPTREPRCSHLRIDDYRDAPKPDSKGVYHDSEHCADCGQWLTHLTRERPSHARMMMIPARPAEPTPTYERHQCPECDGTGWYVDYGRGGEPEQTQCQRCEGSGYVDEAVPVPAAPPSEDRCPRLRIVDLLVEQGYALLEAGDIADWLCDAGLVAYQPSAPLPSGEPTSEAVAFHEGHAIGLHMVIELARGVPPIGDEQADTNVRNAIKRAQEVQDWLEPLAHHQPVASVAAPLPPSDAPKYERENARADVIDGVVLAIANALSEAHIGEELGAEGADGPVWSGEGRAKLLFEARDLIAPLTIEHAKWVIEFSEADRARQLGVAEIVRQLLAEEISERKAVEMLCAAQSPAPCQSLDDIGVDDGATDGYAVSVNRSARRLAEVEDLLERFASAYHSCLGAEADRLRAALLSLIAPIHEETDHV